MSNVQISQVIHLALAYVWLVLCPKATKQKGNKLAGGSVTKNPTLVRHPSLGIYSFNTSLTTSTQNGSKNLQCQLGCA